MGIKTKKDCGSECKISLDGWKKHFRKLLEGSNETTLGAKRKTCTNKNEVERMTVKEIKLGMINLKRKKVSGIDGITNEVWIFGDERIMMELVRIIGKVSEGK